MQLKWLQRNIENIVIKIKYLEMKQISALNNS